MFDLKNKQKILFLFYVLHIYERIIQNLWTYYPNFKFLLKRSSVHFCILHTYELGVLQW